MFNPFSWSLDAWYTALQWASFVILGLTVAMGAMLSKRQGAEVERLDVALANANATAETARANTEALRNENLQLALQVAVANEAASVANKEAAKANERAAALEKEAAAARLELERLKERQTRRRIPIDELIPRLLMLCSNKGECGVSIVSAV